MGIGPIGNSGMVPELGGGERPKRGAFDNIDEQLKLPKTPKTVNPKAKLELTNRDLIDYLPNPLVKNQKMCKFFASILMNLRSGG